MSKHENRKRQASLQAASAGGRTLSSLGPRLIAFFRSQCGSVPDDPHDSSPGSHSSQSKLDDGADSQASGSSAGTDDSVAVKKISKYVGWATWLAAILLALGKKPVAETAAGSEYGDPLPESHLSTPMQAASADLKIEKPSGSDSEKPIEEVQLPTQVKTGTVLVALCLAAAFAGGIGFLVAYWSGGGNTLLGASLALFFGGFGFALILWSHLLSTHIEVIEPRESLAAPTPDLSPAVDDFCCGEKMIRRRGLLKWSAAAGLGMLSAMWISMLRSFSLSPDSSLYSRIWKAGQRLVTADGKPVSVDALQPGAMAIVFPEESIGTEKSQTVLIRVRQDLLRLPRDRAGWAPMGNLAYSRVCTHAGCSVGMYEATTHLLMCPCHQSTFNVLDGAQPTGGPAARPLPQLPLYVDEQGFLRAAGGFTAPSGPGFWGIS